MDKKTIHSHQCRMMEILPSTDVEIVLWNGPSFKTSDEKIQLVGTRAKAMALLEHMGPYFEDCDFDALENKAPAKQENKKEGGGGEKEIPLYNLVKENNEILKNRYNQHTWLKTNKSFKGL